MNAGRARPTLRRLLWRSHVVLVVALVALALLTSAWVLREAMLQQAEAQVELAALNAMRRFEDVQREQQVIGRLLGERPTLTRLLRQGRRSEAEAFLEAYRESAGLDSIRITRDGASWLELGALPPQPDLEGLQFQPDGEAWLHIPAPMEAGPGFQVWIGRRLDPQSWIGNDDAVLHIGLWGSDALLGPARDERQDAYRMALRHALATGQRELVDDAPDFAVLRLEPLPGRDGDVAAVLAVGMPRPHLVRQLGAWLLLLALGTGGLAVLAAFWAQRLGRRISQPFAELVQASHRLGLGDLGASLPAWKRPLAEAESLSRSLDSMRLRLNELTARERAQREELDAVLDGVDEGIVAVDESRHIQYANRRFREMFEDEDVIGKFCGDVLQPEPVDGQRRCDVDCPLLRARQQGAGRSTERCRGGGRSRDLIVHGASPQAGRQVAIVREETPAEASRAMRDAILANLAHEFQTPLAAQVAAIELLRDHVSQQGDPVTRRLVNSQYRGALRLSQLVDNLLDSVRLDTGEMRLRSEPIDLRTVVDEAIALMQPLLDQRDQHVVLETSGKARPLTGDPQRMLQVMVNLLANANKFAPDQSQIWIELIWGEEYVSVWIEDEGPGLPPLARPADLFAPFRRSPDDEPSQRGTGLGLAIVRALVERHGGKVVIAAPRHRQGARFGVVLPFRREG